MHGRSSIKIKDDSYIVPTRVENLIVTSDDIENPGLRFLSTNSGSYPVVAIKHLHECVKSSSKPISISKLKGGNQTTALITQEEINSLAFLDKKIPLTLHQAVLLSREEGIILSELAFLDGEVRRMDKKHTDDEIILLQNQVSYCSEKLSNAQTFLGKNPKAEKLIDELYTFLNKVVE